MDNLLKHFKRKKYCLMKELKASSFQTRDIAKLCRKGIIYKIKPGLYRLSDIKEVPGISSGIIDVCQAIPEGVICLISALDFYELTTFNPHEIYVAVPHEKKVSKIIYPPVKIFYFPERFYRPGIDTIKIPYGSVKIYNREKTICDMFRYRKKLGEDLALEGLKNYLTLEEASMRKIREYSLICQVKTVISPCVKAIVA